MTDTNFPQLYRLNFEVQGDEGEDEALNTRGQDLVREVLQSMRMH